ncbi:AAA family ATPase [Paenibacillus faecalis]|uniref:AAA family ATPase n=1 Tax=Paenibacillus faecalis TaxID=2079532 RepID=UPI000D0ED972|nr:AAA family ATPase [Paenibacillus faecalis]
MIIIITGSAGIGKSTITGLLSKKIKSCVCIHSDSVHNFMVNANISLDFLKITDENISLLIKNFERHGFKNIIVDAVYETLEQFDLAINQFKKIDSNIVSIMLYCDLNENLRRNKLRNNEDIMPDDRIIELNKIFSQHNHFDYKIDISNLSIAQSVQRVTDILFQINYINK